MLTKAGWLVSISNVIVMVSNALKILSRLVGSAATTERILGAATKVVNRVVGEAADQPIEFRASQATVNDKLLGSPVIVTLGIVLKTVR